METEIALLKQGALGYSDAQGHPNSGADTAFPKQGAPDYSDAQDIETLRGPKRRFGERLSVDFGFFFSGPATEAFIPHPSSIVASFLSDFFSRASKKVLFSQCPGLPPPS